MLRDYQQACVSATIKYLQSKRKDKKPGVVVAPTGAGKSWIIAGIIAQLPADKGVLVMQPSKELLMQNAEKFYLATGENPGIYSASVGIKRLGRVTYATLGSIVNKPELFAEIGYILIDECHLYPADGMLLQFRETLSEIPMVGLTATPFRAHFTKGWGLKFKMLNKSDRSPFGEIIHIVQVADVVKWWSVLKYNFRGEQFREDLLQLNRTGSDYTEDSMTLAAKSIRDCIVDDVCKYYVYKRIVVFESTVSAAFDTAKAIAVRGESVEVVTGMTSKSDRDRIVRNFKDGKIRVLVNVGVFIVGFDAPETDLIVLARKTKSLAMYYQMVGRGTRPHPDKEYCRIFDYVGITRDFGRVEHLEFREVPRSGWQLFSGTKRLTGVYF